MVITKLGVLKFVVSGIAGIGTGHIVGKIIKEHVIPETLIEKVTVTAAVWVIGAIATEATKKYTDDAIDNVAETVATVVKNVQLNKKVNRINKGESTFEKEGLDPTNFQKNDKNVWKFSEKKDVIDSATVIGLMRSGQWTYDPDNDVWRNKIDNSKGFHQTNVVGGKIEWLWV